MSTQCTVIGCVICKVVWPRKEAHMRAFYTDHFPNKEVTYA